MPTVEDIVRKVARNYVGKKVVIRRVNGKWLTDGKEIEDPEFFLLQKIHKWDFNICRRVYLKLHELGKYDLDLVGNAFEERAPGGGYFIRIAHEIRYKGGASTGYFLENRFRILLLDKLATATIESVRLAKKAL